MYLKDVAEMTHAPLPVQTRTGDRRSPRTGAIAVAGLTALAVALLFALAPWFGRGSTAQASSQSILSWSGNTSYYYSTNRPFALTSTNGVYSARWQTDGNWVVYHGSNPIWSTKTDNKGIQLGIGPTAGIGIVVKVPYTAWYNNARGGTGSYFLDMQNDGNLVEYKSGVPVWATNTVGR